MFHLPFDKAKIENFLGLLNRFGTDILIFASKTKAPDFQKEV